MCVSYLVAITLTIVPLPEAYQWYRPLFTPLVCLFWAFTNPYHFHLGFVWLFGMLQDVATGTILGHAALGLIVISYIANKAAHRLNIFPPIHQVLFILVLLSLYQLISFWILGITSQLPEAWTYWQPVVVSGICWLVVFNVFHQSIMKLSKH